MPAEARPKTNSAATSLGVRRRPPAGTPRAGRTAPATRAAACRARRSPAPAGSARGCRPDPAGARRRAGRRRRRPDGRPGPSRRRRARRSTPSTTSRPASSSLRSVPPVNGSSGVSRTRARKIVIGRCPARSAWNARTSSAATPRAMVAGSLPARSGIADRRVDPGDRRLVVALDGAAPAGTGSTSPTTRSGRSCRGARSAARRRTARSPRRGRASSPARGCRAGTWPSTSSGSRRVVDVDGAPGRRRGTASRSAVELVGPGVDQVQLEVVPGEDPGQLEPDVTDAEDRDRRDHRAAARAAACTSPPQHCRPCSVRRLVVERHRHRLGRGRPASPSSSRARVDRRSPRGCRRRCCPRRRRRTTTILAPASRGRVPAHVGDGDQHARARVAPQVLDRGQPVHHGTSARATCSDRGCSGSASGPAGRVRRRAARRRRGRARCRAGPARSPSRPPRASPARRGRRWCPAARTRPPPARSASRTRERQHQRRLADRLGAVDRAVLVGPLEQGDVELLGHLGEAGQLVGAGRLGRQPAAVGPVGLVPAQVLQRQPAGALDEAALDLAEVDQRRQAVADVVHDVDPAGAVGAGEAVDLDLGRRGAVGEVLERLRRASPWSPSAGPRCGRSRPPSSWTRLKYGLA